MKGGEFLILPGKRRRQLRGLASMLFDLMEAMDGIAPWEADNDNLPAKARR